MDDLSLWDFVTTDFHVQMKPQMEEILIDISVFSPEIQDLMLQYFAGRHHQDEDGRVRYHLSDVLGFVEANRRRLQSDMLKLSMRLGRRGPRDGDLDNAPVLENWIARRDRSHGGAFLMGEPQGHAFAKSKLTNTSRLCGLDIDLKWARTHTRWYRLGRAVNENEFAEIYPDHPMKISIYPFMTVEQVRKELHGDQDIIGRVN